MARKVKKLKREKLNDGGLIASTLTGATGGFAAGGIGAIPGALFGLGTGILQQIGENEELRKQEALAERQKLLQRQQAFNSTLEPQPANIPLLPLGGLIPYNSETVELESGEPFMTPDGNINTIPINAPKHSQGGVPINLPSGTKVLGKKIDTNGKQFKETGRKLEKAQSRYLNALRNNPTSIEAKTAERMLGNIGNEFDNLFIEQDEDVEQFNKGGRIKYPNGGKVTTKRGVSTPNYRNITPTTFNQQLTRKNILRPGSDTLSVQDVNQQIRQGFNIPEGFALPYRAVLNPDSTITYQKDFGRNVGEFFDPAGSGEVIGTFNEPRTTFAHGGLVKHAKTYGQEHANLMESLMNQGLSFERAHQEALSTRQLTKGGKSGIRKGQNGLLSSNPTPISGIIPTTYPEEGLQGINIPTIPGISTQQPINQPAQNFNIGNALSSVTSLAPVAFNIAQGLGDPTQLDPRDYYNPYEADIRSTFRNRRYNVQPELEANRLAQATYFRNLREAAPSQAQFLGGLQAGAISKSRADAAAIARQQNINNQLLAEQAQADIALGDRRAQTRLGIDQFNLQSEAAGRGFLGTGLSQLSQFAQNRQLMNNQILRDAQRLNLLDDLVANYEFTDGKWVFKATGQEQSPEEVMNFIRG